MESENMENKKNPSLLVIVVLATARIEFHMIQPVIWKTLIKRVLQMNHTTILDHSQPNMLTLQGPFKETKYYA